MTTVEPQSPAAQGSVSEGDIVVRFGDIWTKGIDDLQRLLVEEEVGRSLPVTVVRNASKLELAVTPREMPVG